MARAASWLTCAAGIAVASCHRDAPPSGTTIDAAPQAANAASVPSAADAAAATREDLAPQGTPDAIVREEQDVVVDGVTERWRLEWRHPPVPVCVDESWSSCACAGFAFGERGELDLVRVRPGAKEERMHLAPMFDDAEARLARWPTLPKDREKRPDMAALATRPLVPMMKIADYDHDGRATEMVLQVAAYECGHTPSIVVGIDRQRGLHAFASPDKPNEPWTLDSREAWEKKLTGRF